MRQRAGKHVADKGPNHAAAIVIWEARSVSTHDLTNDHCSDALLRRSVGTNSSALRLPKSLAFVQVCLVAEEKACCPSAGCAISFCWEAEALERNDGHGSVCPG